jgi:hypothetical protein
MIIIPTRGPSPALSALERDVARECAARPDIPVELRVISGGSAARNRNQGALGAHAQWLQFLDDDVRLPSGWLTNLDRNLRAPDAPDLLGATIGSQRPRNWYSQAAEDFVVRNKEYPEGWYLVSAHMTVRLSAFEQLGGFDESFGSAGGEDWDLCRRAHALGLPIGVMSDVHCLHANPTRWSQLAARARAYGAASVTLDPPPQALTSDTSAPPSQDVNPDGIRVEGSRALPVRAGTWVSGEYRTLRRLGRGRLRAARSTALYVPWMATYLRARHRIASE